MMKKYIISVDGGGTKTKAIAYDEKGNDICSFLSGPGSAAVVSENKVWENVYESIDGLLSMIDSNQYQLVYIQIGLSAYSILIDVELNKKQLEEKYKVLVEVASDTYVACYSILKDKYSNGVVALAGTGVAVFGMNNGETCLIGGWGHIIRELGSAYAAVHHFALNIIDTAENGYELSTFQNNFIKYLHEKNINDLKHLFYFHSKTTIASLVTYIKEYAEKGCEEAKKILYQEGIYLAEQTLKAIRKLDLTNDFIVGLRGGFVQKNSVDVVRGFIDTIRNNGILSDIISDNDDPAIGGYYIAKNKYII